jgi:hypothetical protein
MPNTLTAVLPTIYEALDVVSRELVGFIPAVTRNSTAERAAVSQSITYPVVPTIVTENITPGVSPASSGDQTIGSLTMTISKSKAAPIRWTGEEQRSLSVGDRPQLGNILRDQFAQAFRALVNEVEADLGALYVEASRAYGTAGTVPFGTNNDFTDLSNVYAILDQNGAPTSDRHIVLDSLAMANLRGKQSQVFKVNEAGTAETLRTGAISNDLMGFMIHNSAQVQSHTKGTGTGYLVNNASGYAVGSTTIAADTGSGTIVAGDILTNSQAGRDANKYVVKTALATGSLSIANPGNLVAWVDNDSLAVGNNYRANLAFSRNAIHLVTRQPAMPEGGDDADDVATVTDPFSGLSFQVAIYRQYRQVKYEIGLAWGVKMVKPEHCAILLG